MTTELRSEIGLFTATEVAAMLEVTTHTLAMWRVEKRGPAFVKLGRSIFYRRDDVQKWVDANVCPPGEEAAA